MQEDYPYNIEEEVKAIIAAYLILGFWNILALLCTVAGGVFIFLKLFNAINWSWWLVLLPIYGFLSLIVIITVIILGLALLLEFIENIKDKNKIE